MLRLLNISRPRFWMYALGPYLIGIGAAQSLSNAVVFNLDIVFWLIYFTLPANLFVYGINDLADGDTDAFNEKKGTYEARVDAKEKKTLIWAIILFQIPFIPLLYQASFLEQMACAAFILFNLAYSLPPLRLKARPFLDSLSNGVFCASVGLMGYFAAGGTEIWWLPVIAGAIWSSVMHAYSAIPDIEADTKAGIATIATILKAKAALWVCLVGYIAVALCLWMSGLYAHTGLVIPYIVLIAASFYMLRKKGSVFSIYMLYPFVTYLVGYLVYHFNVYIV